MIILNFMRMNAYILMIIAKWLFRQEAVCIRFIKMLRENMQYIKDYFRGIWKNRFVLVSLVKQDLQMKYNRSALGVAWSIITPMGLSIIIGLVYSIIFGTDPRTFVPLLFAGLNPWNFLNGSAEGGTYSYLSSEGYVKQTTVTPQIFPLRGVMVAYVNLLYSIIAFFVIYLILAPDNFNPKMLMIFPGLIVVFFAGVSLANISSTINLYIRDYQPLQSLILQGLFYVTPIIFTTDMLDQKGFSLVYKINPFYYLIEIVRTPMIGTRIPAAEVYIIGTGLTLIIFIISVIITMRTCKGLALKL